MIWLFATLGPHARAARNLMAVGRMDSFKAVSTEVPELSERFDRVLQAVVDALEPTSIPYLFIGGVASGGLGRPRSTADIDILIRPEDRERVLQALKASGFETEKTDPIWLYKAFQEGILVDIIFKSKGEVYLDPQMLEHQTQAEFHGKQLRLVSPEDLILIKALAHSEFTPGHWHDALALISYAKLDWEYLLQRARLAPRRLLSLLLYAQSSDLGVPDFVVSRLYQLIFSAQAPAPSLRAPRARRELRPMESILRYEIERLQEDFALDERLGELAVSISGEMRLGVPYLVLQGEAMTEEARERLTILAKKRFPEGRIENQVRVLEPLSWSTEAA
ncbi:MAG: nucleotidyltransferase [Bdellovibrionales bacterium]|nr:nucleotidyltransferase [Bdellovibrionales bacterium]